VWVDISKEQVFTHNQLKQEFNEIVSASSVEKDKETLLDLYWRAAIPEYWIVDARTDRLEFDIFRHTVGGYVATPRQAGWLKSNIFGKSFRLTRRLDDTGNPEYTLSVR
jgi:hypothetical protein